ncbi:hypothetical protein MIND_00293700 [Mycena indigotica]|uniref:Transmembrane protein n=1 Tax=Mycena indigotica TaxID=2126181 RepID=A0A8H6WE96_9AGAR|nr:uncharacterized protein MIND_00293700 [Mycena indigotica]KAF7309234.1 hypothetical protein MIND_00293700 [Mycena indigotica]
MPGLLRLVLLAASTLFGIARSAPTKEEHGHPHSSLPGGRYGVTIIVVVSIVGITVLCATFCCLRSYLRTPSYDKVAAQKDLENLRREAAIASAASWRASGGRPLSLSVRGDIPHLPPPAYDPRASEQSSERGPSPSPLKMAESTRQQDSDDGSMPHPLHVPSKSQYTIRFDTKKDGPQAF